MAYFLNDSSAINGDLLSSCWGLDVAGNILEIWCSNDEKFWQKNHCGVVNACWFVILIVGHSELNLHMAISKWWTKLCKGEYGYVTEMLDVSVEMIKEGKWKIEFNVQGYNVNTT